MRPERRPYGLEAPRFLNKRDWGGGCFGQWHRRGHRHRHVTREPGHDV